MESVLLPTVAYVGGPGELRYLRLAEVLYPALDAHRQIPVPRWSGVLVEPRVNRTADKFGLTVTELIAGDGALEQRVLKSLSPRISTRRLRRRGRQSPPGSSALPPWHARST